MESWSHTCPTKKWNVSGDGLVITQTEPRPSAIHTRRKMSSQRRRVDQAGDSSSSDAENPGILDERLLFLVFGSMRWDIHALCQTASVNTKLRALAKRLLWRELCVYRAPRMIASLTNGAPNGRIGGGWQAMAKLLFYCCGCQSSRHFGLGRPSPGHFARETRFSKTSGRSFLVSKCRGDVLYVSDPCEHPSGDREDDLGIYRGVFGGFMKSRTRACLIRRQVGLEERVKCPYCGARVWSMTAARLIPKSAARRLGSLDGGSEYFVCVNGHLHGACWLVPLSDDDGGGEEDEEGGADDGDEEEDAIDRNAGNPIANGSH
ncbi:PREDICTED: EID1-like F-box protein 3 [Ipomoea nil]|uniref:EID1-like F-box protein 3 n=1 Tax=Ipomoea nil TaxID=35883 RepID=UPI00090186F5|nr:PREDICTED: EID1-like F-box protein 3 [Ipomoea nil]